MEDAPRGDNSLSFSLPSLLLVAGTRSLNTLHQSEVVVGGVMMENVEVSGTSTGKCNRFESFLLHAHKWEILTHLYNTISIIVPIGSISLLCSSLPLVKRNPHWFSYL